MQAVLRSTVRLFAGLLPLFVAGRVAAQAPVITTNPISQTNAVGASVLFSVTATGAEPLSYFWYYNDVRIPAATNANLVVPLYSVLESGTYLAVVTNAFGSATSAPATMTVLGRAVFVSQPIPQSAYLGQSATFSAQTLGTDPVTLQWLFQGVPISNATNNTLLLTNVTASQAGVYSLQAVNAYGFNTSLGATLTVNPLPPPALRLGVLTATNRIRVPVLFTAHSSETNLGFSVTFDPAVFTNATFVPERLLGAGLGIPDGPGKPVRPSALPMDAVVTVDDSMISGGSLGVTITWSAPSLPPGEGEIGRMVFDLVPGRTILEGLLGVSGQPVAATVAPPVNGTNAVILNPMNPQVVALGPITLNRQTGFQQQVVTYGNPGNSFVSNTRMTIDGLGFDSFTNLVTLANSQGWLLPLLVPYVDLGAVAPREERQALMEFYVTDRVTVPTPIYGAFGTPPVVLPTPNGSVLTNVVTRWTNGMVLVEFPTVLARRYYIQYAPTVAGFTNGTFSTSLPSMIGTGSRRQWMDSGPPRTGSQPVDGGRFYRVVEAQ